MAPLGFTVVTQRMRMRVAGSTPCLSAAWTTECLIHVAISWSFADANSRFCSAVSCETRTSDFRSLDAVAAQAVASVSFELR
eukprot:5946468-Alexandrium_andersonii.AAC.1